MAGGTNENNARYGWTLAGFSMAALCLSLPIQTRDLRIFGDESSHTGDKDYLTYGTLACDGKNLDAVAATLERASGDSLSELKWNNLKTRNLRRYRRFVTAIRDLLKGNGPLWYKCVVIPVQESNYRENLKRGMRDFVFYNLIAYARDHDSVPAQFTALLDRGVPFSVTDLRDRLNNRDQDEHQKAGRFTSITEGDSKDSRLIQAADFLTGFMAYANNADESIESWRMSFAKEVARLLNIPFRDQQYLKAGIKQGDLATFRFSTIRRLGHFSIFRVDWKKEQVAEYQRDSAAQLAELPQGALVSDLLKLGYRFEVMCPRCEHRHPDFFVTRPTQLHVADYRPPRCSKCPKPKPPLLPNRGLLFVTRRPH